MKRRAAVLFIFGSLISGCTDQEAESGEEAAIEPKPVSAEIPDQRTVSGLLKHYPSDVRSAQAWHGHNFIVGETPVISTEEVPEEELMKFVGSEVVITGVWHPGNESNPREDQGQRPIQVPLIAVPQPMPEGGEVVVRGDGLKASSISPVEKQETQNLPQGGAEQPATGPESKPEDK